MTPPRLHGLVGAAIAVGLAAAAVAFPGELAEGPRQLLPAEPGPAACLLGCDAVGSAVGRIERQLGAEMPSLGADRRGALARTIVAEAQAARIDPLLVLALIEVESSFDPRALSGAGARGLMQLREPTMRRELQRAGLLHLDLHDPAANVVAGVRYLRRLLDAFGREEVALMAYNAGPNRILGYLREGEIPARFHAYPRRVQALHRKLRRSAGGTAVVAAAPLAVARVPVAAE
ncbi:MULTISPECIES: lytic transglycosylase domain-containing protein [Anaeromyxobacter]|uniref:lytic transglycosylase domain-containing protein n=1 Tax=Anaeromyxobacter TaxID=161492 RepID=UPI001F56C761|nr:MULTISPECIES: lytic transglycosylase domain-containing protein [unclassified Anaeromyxobacter]